MWMREVEDKVEEGKGVDEGWEEEGEDASHSTDNVLMTGFYCVLELR